MHASLMQNQYKSLLLLAKRMLSRFAVLTIELLLINVNKYIWSSNSPKIVPPTSCESRMERRSTQAPAWLAAKWIR